MISMAENKLITLTGRIVKILWDADGYIVFVLRSLKTSKMSWKETCVARMPIHSFEEGQEYSVVGSYEFNQKYGRNQFSVAYVKNDIPVDEAGIRDYLGRHLKGIGKVTANNIVDAFGTATWEIIENSPEELCKVKGISIIKANKIFREYISKIGSRDDMIWFNTHHIINFNYITEIKQFFKYRNKSYKAELEANPYKLINIVNGIGFKKADDIASTFGFAGDNPYRIAAGIKHILENATNFGHVYLTEQELIESARELLGVQTSKIKEVLNRLLEKDETIREKDPVCFIRLVDDNGAIYEETMYIKEDRIATYLKNLSNTTPLMTKRSKEAVFKKIDEISKRKHDENFELDISQKEAVYNCVNNAVSVITGGPGTGKTTTLNTIISYLEEELHETSFVLLAPTGKAAKRMNEQTGKEATTIHKAVGYGANENKQIHAQTVIIDEMSMTDMKVMEMLVKALCYVKRLILVGDIDQLPSVGPGNVLKDIIDSGIIPVSRLNVIHRQAEKSGIIKYSHGIIEEKMFPENPDVEDFVFINCDNVDAVEEQVISMYTEGLPQYLKEKGLDPESVQILTPLKKDTFKLSSGSFNMLIQEKNAKQNPLAHCVKFFKDNIYYEGDKVIHIKNDYKLVRQKSDGTVSLGVMNGETGVVIEADDDAKTLAVKYEDDIVVYTKESISELTLAYALTIHKSQGSEYQAVIIPIVNYGISSIYNKNLLYTAVTRAKALVILIGSKATYTKMVHTKFSEKRNTKLCQRLKNA